MDMNIKLLFNVALVFIQTIKPISSDYDLFDFKNSFSDEPIPDDQKGRK